MENHDPRSPAGKGDVMKSQLYTDHVEGNSKESEREYNKLRRSSLRKEIYIV